jgi:hypothetical protein
VTHVHGPAPRKRGASRGERPPGAESPAVQVYRALRLSSAKARADASVAPSAPSALDASPSRLYYPTPLFSAPCQSAASSQPRQMLVWRLLTRTAPRRLSQPPACRFARGGGPGPGGRSPTRSPQLAPQAAAALTRRARRAVARRRGGRGPPAETELEGEAARELEGGGGHGARRGRLGGGGGRSESGRLGQCQGGGPGGLGDPGLCGGTFQVPSQVRMGRCRPESRLAMPRVCAARGARLHLTRKSLS